MAVEARALHVVLIRPTKYDDDGYPLRHWRGVLPSNTLACLKALTDGAVRGGALAPLRVATHVYDESVQAVPWHRICRLGRGAANQVVVALVGVQTNQFPRAVDLARRFRTEGVPVLIGGFHVSGLAVSSPTLPAEIEELMASGVSVVLGEVEGSWTTILRDAAEGRLRRRYDALGARPELAEAPVPSPDPALQRHFVYRHFGTVESSRGCPFQCSFCSIIAVQGRSMRSREPGAIAEAIAATYARNGTHHWFFTDDDLARNPRWGELFDELTRLREEAGLPLRFLMQADAQAHRLPGFVARARRAGCFQVFLGLESLNPANLSAAQKRQNRVGEYADLVDVWRRAGILTHAGYIIGFGEDTPESVAQNVDSLARHVGVDLASFFMLTPLPGSADYRRLIAEGRGLDADPNRHDTFHPVVDHPRMSRDEWFAAYRDAWRRFYTDANMARAAARWSGEQRVTLLQLYLWYLCATTVDEFHPMMTGFVRRKERRDRRPGLAMEGRFAFWKRRLPELTGMCRGYARAARRVHRVWRSGEAGVDRPQIATADGATFGPVSWREEVIDAVSFARAMFGRGTPEPGTPPLPVKGAEIPV